MFTGKMGIAHYTAAPSRPATPTAAAMIKKTVVCRPTTAGRPPKKNVVLPQGSATSTRRRRRRRRRRLRRHRRLRRRRRRRRRRRLRPRRRRRLPRLRRPLSSRTRSSRATNTAGTTAGRAKIGMPPSSTKSTAACAAGRHRSSAWAAASRMRHGCRRRPAAGSTVLGCARWPSCPRRGTRAAASTRRTCGCGSRAIMVPKSTTCPWERGSFTWPRTAWAAITPPSPVGSGSAKRRRRCERCAAAPTR